MKTIITTLIAFLLLGCTPLKQVQTKQINNVSTVDSTLISVIKKELQNQLTEISTTVIEFAQIDSSATTPLLVIENIKPIKVSQPIRRITTTQIVHKIDKVKEVDSTEQRRITLIDKTKIDTELEEKPSNFVQGIKWVGVILLVVLVITAVLKWG